MSEEPPYVASSRFFRLAQEFRDKEFRENYVAAHTRRFLARQMRKFRGEFSQSEFAKHLGKRQTIVSRLENPNYSGWTVGTLLEIANKLNVGVVVRFVDFPTFLKCTDDMSEDAMRPAPYDEDLMKDFERKKAEQEVAEAKVTEILPPQSNEAGQAAAEAQSRKISEEAQKGRWNPSPLDRSWGSEPKQLWPSPR